MKKIIMCALLVFVAAALGCVPGTQKRVVGPESDVIRAPFVKEDLIDKKIRFLDSVLKQKEITDTDSKTALDLLDAYKLIKKASSGDCSREEYDGLVQALFRSLSVLDEKYFSKQYGMVQGYSKSVSDFVNKRNKVLDAYVAGDFKGTMDQCLELKTVFGPDALTPEVAVLFALSMGREGLMKEAINIGEGIVNELEANPDIFYLRSNISEWYLKTGQQKKAIATYGKLTDTLDEKQAILQSLSEKITETDKAQRLSRHKALGLADVPMDEFLRKAGELIQENRFGEAWDLLTLKKNQVSSGPELEEIDRVIRKLELAEEEYIEQKISMISRERQTLKSARNLVEEERFEDALSSLDSIGTHQEFNREITELKDQAIEGIINRERNRAANMFLKAKKTQDPVKKEKYLRTSYDMLKSLIEKYPLSPLNQKLKSHIKRVEEELNRL
ncbi:MAG: hypothetical protein U9N82_04580 [Thermodesulfobacteriota bacterium]|nr:hypothetical protein [Thermodesulfobacteriota bacterium]